MQENKPHLTFKNTKKKICLEKKREFFLTLTPSAHVPLMSAANSSRLSTRKVTLIIDNPSAAAGQQDLVTNISCGL